MPPQLTGINQVEAAPNVTQDVVNQLCKFLMVGHLFLEQILGGIPILSGQLVDFLPELSGNLLRNVFRSLPNALTGPVTTEHLLGTCIETVSKPLFVEGIGVARERRAGSPSC